MVVPSLYIYIQQKYLFTLNFEFLGVQPFGFAFMKEKWKQLAQDVIHTSAIHTYLVHDIADVDCQTQNGSIHRCVFTTLNISC